MVNSPAIEVLNLHKSFGQTKAVQDVSFDVQQGEIFSLLGPNGAGKTTTISMLCCLLRPDEGEARVMGHSIRSDPTGVKSVLGVVPQEIALYEDLTARENMVFWGKMYGLRGRALMATGVVFCASTFGIFINSFLKTAKQGGVIFGGVLTVTGMLGMISIFAMNSPAAARLSETVALLVPQGWAIRGLLQVMDGQPVSDVIISALVMLAWSAAFFAIGVWRFNKRYA